MNTLVFRTQREEPYLCPHCGGAVYDSGIRGVGILPHVCPTPQHPGSLTVLVPATPAIDLSINRPVGWRRKHEATLELKGTTIRAFRGAMDLNDPYRCYQRAVWPLTLSYVVAWERHRNRWDDDNLKGGGLKPVQDGVAWALGIDDRHFVTGTVTQARDPEGVGVTIVIVTPAGVTRRSRRRDGDPDH